MNRLQAAEQMRRAVQLYAGTLPEEKALEIATIYPKWEAGKAYAAGDILSYGTNSVGDPQLYKVVQAHTSQADWTPDSVPALYDAFGLDESGYPIWSQPSGAHDAYNTGDVVNYNGTLYQSLIDGNVWSPDAYPDGWKIVESGTEEEPTTPTEPEPEPTPTPEYPEWVQPTGAHDAYNTGDIVSHNGKIWQSNTAGNVWEPGVYGWDEVTA